MSLRQAFVQARWASVAVLAAIGWMLLTALTVASEMQPFWSGAGPGQTAATGVVGLIVLAGMLLLAVVLFGELGEAEPTPETWPPEE